MPLMQSLKNLNETAINLCDKEAKTLIFTSHSDYIPSFKTMIEFRESVFFIESNDIFEIITLNFDFFDSFILVSKTLNLFEQEFFNQLRVRYKKKIIELT